MNFNAVILNEINKPLGVYDIETTDLKIGQVLVKISVSGLCGAQLQEIAGKKGNSKFLPHLIGHEGCGRVVAVGGGVSNVKVGNKVVLHWRKGKGIESDFPNYIYNGKTISSGKVTTLSEYSVVSENRLTPVPDDSPDDLCALLGCGITTGLGIINNECDIKFGESVLILGSGGVGLNLIQGARMANAYPIYATDITLDKKELAMKMGATQFINVTDTDLSTAIANKKIDIIIDTTGNQSVISNAIGFLSDTGRFIMVSQPNGDKSIVIPDGSKLFNGNGQTIKATQGGKTVPEIDIPRYVKLFNANILKYDTIITHRFKLNDINSAVELLKTGTAGRIMIDMN